MDKENEYPGILFSLRKEGNPAIYENICKLGKHCAL